MYVHIPQSVINLLPLFQFLQMKSLLAVLTTWSNLSVVAFNFDLNLKSINLQYIMLGCLDDGTKESSTKSLMYQVHIVFFTLFIDLGHSNFFFIFVILK